MANLNDIQQWIQAKRFEKENLILKNSPNLDNRVVFMGDSITEFWLKINPTFFKTNYINRGISGQTSSQMLLRFRNDVIELQPKIIVILAGINDIAENTGKIPLETVFGNLVSMMELATINKSKIIIGSLLPADFFPWKSGLNPVEKIQTFNQWLQNYATKNNHAFVDFFPAMANQSKGMKSELADDGVHPNLKGYQIMEPLIEKEIQLFLQ